MIGLRVRRSLILLIYRNIPILRVKVTRRDKLDAFIGDRWSKRDVKMIRVNLFLL